MGGLFISLLDKNTFYPPHHSVESVELYCVCLSVCLFVCLSVCLSVCVFVCLYVCLYV